jgi:hypothetical protein
MQRQPCCRALIGTAPVLTPRCAGPILHVCKSSRLGGLSKLAVCHRHQSEAAARGRVPISPLSVHHIAHRISFLAAPSSCSRDLPAALATHTGTRPDPISLAATPLSITQRCSCQRTRRSCPKQTSSVPSPPIRAVHLAVGLCGRASLMPSQGPLAAVGL